MSSAVPIPLDQVPVISLKGVTKTYTFYEAPSARLYALLRQTLGAKNSDGRKFTAVQGIDLEIMPGECVGIIGRNGAGKSTLLQMIAGTLQPSSGTIQVRGRVAALLELGSGFNPEFTGRENIHLNAAILGLTKKEVAAKFDDIVAYSGIAEFIDQPVRTYSSGMSLRLAFSVCVHVDADILIIDEALAVGDARFQFKCHATLDQMRAAGKTIIFVSHDTNSVKRMCKTALLLERGEALIKGSPNDVTNLYTKLITSPHGVEAIRTDIEALRNLPLSPLESEKSSITSTAMTEEIVSEVSAKGVQLIVEERDHQQISDKEYSYGGERGVITDVLLQDEKKQPRLSFMAGVRMSIRLRCKAREDVIDPIYAITIKDVKGTEVFGTNTYFQDLKTAHVRAGAETQVSFELTLNLLPGVFFISAGWVRLENAEVQVIHRRYDVVRFDVLPRDRSFGVAYCPTKIIVEPIANSSA